MVLLKNIRFLLNVFLLYDYVSSFFHEKNVFVFKFLQIGWYTHRHHPLQSMRLQHWSNDVASNLEGIKWIILHVFLGYHQYYNINMGVYAVWINIVYYLYRSEAGYTVVCSTQSPSDPSVDVRSWRSTSWPRSICLRFLKRKSLVAIGMFEWFDWIFHVSQTLYYTCHDMLFCKSLFSFALVAPEIRVSFVMRYEMVEQLGSELGTLHVLVNGDPPPMSAFFKTPGHMARRSKRSRCSGKSSPFSKSNKRIKWPACDNCRRQKWTGGLAGNMASCGTILLRI